MSTILELVPTEILVEIFSYLKFRDIAVVKRLSRSFYILANDRIFYTQLWKDLNIAGDVPDQPHLILKHYKRRYIGPHITIDEDTEYLAPHPTSESKLGILTLKFNEEPLYKLDGRCIDPAMNELLFKSLNGLKAVYNTISSDDHTKTTETTKLKKYLDVFIKRTNKRYPHMNHSYRTVTMVASLEDISIIKDLPACLMGGMCFRVYIGNVCKVNENFERDIIDDANDQHFSVPDLMIDKSEVAILVLKDDFVKAIFSREYKTDIIKTTTALNTCIGADDIIEYNRVTHMYQSTVKHAAKFGLNHKRAMTTGWRPIAVSDMNKNISVYADDMWIHNRYSLLGFIKYLTRYGYIIHVS